MKHTGKRKSKRARKQPKCTLCNPFRWLGNSKSRHSHAYYRQQTTDEAHNIFSKIGE